MVTLPPPRELISVLVWQDARFENENDESERVAVDTAPPAAAVGPDPDELPDPADWFELEHRAGIDSEQPLRFAGAISQSDASLWSASVFEPIDAVRSPVKPRGCLRFCWDAPRPA